MQEKGKEVIADLWRMVGSFLDVSPSFTLTLVAEVHDAVVRFPQSRALPAYSSFVEQTAVNHLLVVCGRDVDTDSLITVSDTTNLPGSVLTT